MRRLPTTLGALALALGSAACAGVLGLDAGEPLDDADAAAASSTATLDRVDADVDAEPEPGAPPDAAPPSTSPDTPDAAPAHESLHDAGSDVHSPYEAGSILCGDAACAVNLTKCMECNGTPMGCVAWATAAGSCSVAYCDETADCPIGTRCCASPPAGAVSDMVYSATCMTSCGSKFPLCDPAKGGECPSPTACKPFANYYACQ